MSKYRLKKGMPGWVKGVLIICIGIPAAIALGILIYGGCVGVTFPEAAKICLPFLFRK